ncbi:hypothetical protein HK097_010621 [Rhizophlyctis rosea]|uniref:Uncharacterized protein n=1 Tax=Rhizophlyctis rosea TaxID=64517 RepID=A0AAD5S7C0_9FUNG|nr:hypothetical protein HK097_010621 [Rhizophlyctis rosea]
MGVYPNEQDMTVYTEFDELCSEMLSVVGEFETALEDMTMWKDDFLKQQVPSNVKLHLTLLFARLFRSKSDMHEPMFELIKQVRLYSRPWLDKRFALVELEKDWQRQNHILNIAIRKLEKLQMQREASCIMGTDDETIDGEGDIAQSDVMLNFQDGLTLITPQDIFMGSHGQFTPIGDVQPTVVPLSFDEESDIPKPSTAGTTISIRSADQSRAATAPGSRDSVAPKGRSSHHDALSSAREYITEDSPSWRRKAKTLVRKFTRILRDQHPGYEQTLARIHRRPFPTPVQPKYLSPQAGSIIDRQPRICSLRKAWSLVDLRIFHSETTDAELSHLGRKSTPDDPPKLVRSNSYNVLHCLSGNARLRSPMEPIPKDERERERERGLWRAMAVQRERARSSSRGRSARQKYEDDSDDDCSDEDDYETFDERYMQEFDDKEMQETINRFIDEHPFGPSDAGANEFNGAMDAVDGSKEQFTLQDVMELTLLHAQQMQILQTEYEERVDTLTNQMTEMEAATAAMREEYEKRIQQVQERAQRIALEYVKQSKEGTGTADTPSSADAANKALLEDLGVQEAAPTPVVEKKKKTPSLRRKTGWRERKTPARRMLHLVQRRVLPPRDKPVYTSAPFTMSFMERLRFWTEVKLQKRGAIQDKFQTIEKAANEEKLKQYHLLAQEGGAQGSKDDAHLPAEFMPMPGSVPPHKIRDAWADQGINMPWGGRYNVARRDLERVNILNLFDVALNLPPPPPPPNREPEDGY